MHCLDGPAALHELPCEVVEQFRMARGIGAQPEVIGSRHQSGTEMMEPNAVHHHPRRERVLPVGDRLSELKSTAALLEWSLLAPGQDGQKLSRSFFPQS